MPLSRLAMQQGPGNSSFALAGDSDNTQVIRPGAALEKILGDNFVNLTPNRKAALVKTIYSELVVTPSGLGLLCVF